MCLHPYDSGRPHTCACKGAYVDFHVSNFLPNPKYTIQAFGRAFGNAALGGFAFDGSAGVAMGSVSGGRWPAAAGTWGPSDELLQSACWALKRCAIPEKASLMCPSYNSGVIDLPICLVRFCTDLISFSSNLTIGGPGIMTPRFP